MLFTGSFENKMTSKLPSVLSATDDEIRSLLAAKCHIGTKNCEKAMESYVWKRRQDGTSPFIHSKYLFQSDYMFQESTSSTLVKPGKNSSWPHA